MEGKTYVELLAENDFLARSEYDENAKDLLVEHNEYEDEHIPAEDHHPDEIEDQQDFKKFGGSHQESGAFHPTKETEIKSKQHVEYDKHVRIHVLSIDSRFRDDITQLSTNFTYKFYMPLKNITHIRVSDVEIPNTYFTFSPARGNTVFYITTYQYLQNNIVRPFVKQQYLIQINPGNYDQMDLQNEINYQFSRVLPNALLGGSDYKAVYNIQTGRMTLENINRQRFDLDFALEQFSPRIRDFGLGHNLGFRVKHLEGAAAYTGSGLVDVIDNNYLFLSLDPDWKVVTHRTPDRSHIYSFAKIIINQPKGAVVYDTGLDTVTREYTFKQPSNISNIPVSILDPYGQLVDLEGMDFSFTLELTEVLNSSLYESIRSS